MLAANSSAPARGVPVLLIGALGLALGAAGAWWWARDRIGPDRTRPAATVGTDAVIAPTRQARPLPPLGQMDTFLRALLGSLSSSPELVRWLATDDLIRQMAHAIDRVSRGASPAREVAVLRPVGIFATAGRPGQVTIDPATYHRFDGLATLVSSLDARAVADAYYTIQPRLDEAYRALGRAEGGVDHALAVALQVLIETPSLEDPVRLVPGLGATYAYADSQLENLQPAQKQLLRMGPQNLARVKTRLREIKEAMQTSRND